MSPRTFTMDELASITAWRTRLTELGMFVATDRDEVAAERGIEPAEIDNLVLHPPSRPGRTVFIVNAWDDGQWELSAADKDGVTDTVGMFASLAGLQAAVDHEMKEGVWAYLGRLLQ